MSPYNHKAVMTNGCLLDLNKFGSRKSGGLRRTKLAAKIYCGNSRALRCGLNPDRKSDII